MQSPRPLLRLLPLALAPVLLSACSGDVPAADDVEAASVLPAAMPAPDHFDSIRWADTRNAVDRGATVYAYSCARCHGDSGAGDGNYHLNKRVLRPPSFLTSEWKYSGDLEGLRDAVYAGNDKGMPHWGNAGLSARDTDAVARYILYGLREEAY